MSESDINMAQPWEGQAGLREIIYYNRWLAELVEPFLGRSVLEIGGGTGNVTEHLLPKAKKYVAVDIYRPHVEFLSKRFSKEPGFLALTGNIADSHFASSLSEYEFDTAISINCLEHVEDDRALLEAIFQILIPGGKAIILVPGLTWLYNNLDRKAEHYRRYSRDDLKAKLTSAGFRVEHIRYHNLIGVLPWLIQGWRIRKDEPTSHLKDATPFLTMYRTAKQFSLILKIYLTIEKRLWLPVGQSLLAVARRGNDT